MREAIAAGDAKSSHGRLQLHRLHPRQSVQKGVLHKNTASRYKSRLNARVKAVVVAKKAA